MDIRTFITLENALTRRLQKDWQKRAVPIYAAIQKACLEKRWENARYLVSQLDMTETGTENREWIKYLLLSCFLFGAARVAKEKPLVDGLTFDKTLNQVTQNILTYLEHSATEQVQQTALQLIAQEELKTVKKADTTGRFVTPFADFSNLGNDAIQLISSLNASRLATWGFTAEAEIRNVQTYKITPVLDGRICAFCLLISGQEFSVKDAREKILECLQAQNPEDLKTIQPWPSVTKEALLEYRDYTEQDFVEAGLHIPPYHARCRCVLTTEESEAPRLEKPALPEHNQLLPEQIITLDTLKELGMNASQEQVDHWNSYVKLSPVAVLQSLSGKDPKDILKGVLGKKPIQFLKNGDIAMKSKGILDSVKYSVGTVLDPYTGTYYLSQAEFVAGNPQAAKQFVGRLMNSLIDVGVSTAAKSLVIYVAAGEAVNYIRLGFLPTQENWDTIRVDLLQEMKSGSLEEMADSLTEDQYRLIQHILQNRDPESLSVLVDLDLEFEGDSIGDILLKNVSGNFSLNLADEDLVDQTRGNL